jgi:hypothetical protein
MKKLILLLIVSVAFAFTVQSQNAADSIKNQPVVKKCCFKFASIALSSGVNKYRTMGHDDNDFEKSTKDHSNWNSGNLNFMSSMNMGDMTTRNLLTFEIGLNPWSKKLNNYNKKRELTIGLFYSGSDLESRKSMEFASTPGDTFTINSIKYQTDTVSRTSKSHVVNANVLGASVQYLFKTDPEKRISLFTGVGIDAAFAITSRIHDNYQKDSSVMLSFYGNKTNYDQFDNGYFLGSEEQKSSLKADPTIFASINMPFGVNFRLCKKKDIWNQMNIFIRGNLGLETEIVVHHETHFNPYIGCAVGFKFDFK